MKRRIFTGLVMIAIIIAALVYYPISKEPVKEAETSISDKDGKVVEPMNSDNNNIGH